MICTLYLSDITSSLRVVLSVVVACSPPMTSSEARLQCVLKCWYLETDEARKECDIRLPRSGGVRAAEKEQLHIRNRIGGLHL